jgi:hypothetical protein
LFVGSGSERLSGDDSRLRFSVPAVSESTPWSTTFDGGFDPEGFSGIFLWCNVIVFSTFDLLVINFLLSPGWVIDSSWSAVMGLPDVLESDRCLLSAATFSSAVSNDSATALASGNWIHKWSKIPSRWSLLESLIASARGWKNPRRFSDSKDFSWCATTSTPGGVELSPVIGERAWVDGPGLALLRLLLSGIASSLSEEGWDKEHDEEETKLISLVVIEVCDGFLVAASPAAAAFLRTSSSLSAKLNVGAMIWDISAIIRDDPKPRLKLNYMWHVRK